jgi:hypothetical protein
VRAILSGHRLPPDADEIMAKLRDVPLPARTGEDGVSWSLFVAQCAGCRTVRAVSNAHLLDLVRVPALVQDIRARRFAPERCPHCGDIRGLPVALLDQDAPLCGDPLESMSGIVRIGQNAVIFRPPPGTPDRKESRVLLEMRFERLLDRENGRLLFRSPGRR